MNISTQDIIREWGLQSLPKEKQDEMVERIGHLIYQAILVRSLDILSDKEQDEFDQLLDQDSTTIQDVLIFLNKKIPNLTDVITEERQKLRADLLIPIS